MPSNIMYNAQSLLGTKGTVLTNHVSLSQIRPKPTFMVKKNKRMMSPQSITKKKSKPTYDQVAFITYKDRAIEKRKLERKQIYKNDILRVMHLSQSQACQNLNCSLSTLKRRFCEIKHELGIQQWPQNIHDIRHLPIFHKIYPMTLSFVMNERNRDEKDLRDWIKSTQLGTTTSRR